MAIFLFFNEKFKKLSFGVKFYSVSQKLDKISEKNIWIKKRKEFLYQYNLEKFIEFEGNIDKTANIYFLNHQSFVETLFIPYIINDNIIAVVKKELQLSKLSKGFTKFDIGINRSDPRSSLKMIKQIKKEINADNKIIIYPEGTRNRTNNPLLPFKENLGKLLSRENLKVQGIVIVGLKDFIKGKRKKIKVKYLNTYNTKEDNWCKNIYNEMYNNLKN